MGSPSSDYALILSAPDLVEMELARELLASAGIPSLVHGQDRSFADLGAFGQITVAGPDLFVPKSAIERARALLEEAWDRSALSDELAESAPPEEKQPAARFGPASVYWLLLIALAILGVVALWLGEVRRAQG